VAAPLAMIMCARPSTLAAPPMSFFISPIDAPGLRFSPPVSKHTPLPTRVRSGPSLPHVMSIRRGASSLARPTVWMSGRLAVQQAFAMDAGDRRAEMQPQDRAPPFQLPRAHVLGGRVDQVAGQRFRASLPTRKDRARPAAGPGRSGRRNRAAWSRLRLGRPDPSGHRIAPQSPQLPIGRRLAAPSCRL
jgi:hypothetical protein